MIDILRTILEVFAGIAIAEGLMRAVDTWIQQRRIDRFHSRVFPLPEEDTSNPGVKDTTPHSAASDTDNPHEMG